MKVKLLKKMRKRFYWHYNQERINYFTFYDKKNNKEHFAFSPFKRNKEFLYHIMCTWGKMSLYEYHECKRQKRRNLKKYASIL